MSTPLETLVATLRSTDLASADIADLVRALRPHTAGHVIQGPQCPVGTLLFRGRVCDSVDSVSELSYPPAELTQIGRLNRPGSPLFYASPSRRAIFFELPLAEGSVVLISRWRTTATMLLNHLGYHDRVFEDLGSGRTVASWDGKTNPHLLHPSSEPVWNSLGYLFTQTVPSGEEPRYKLSVAVAECMFGAPFAGILYPSVAMSANADNIALLPRWADQHLRFIGVERIVLKAIEGRQLQVHVSDYATSPDGIALDWKGRGPIWRITEQGASLRIESDGEIWRAFTEAGIEIDPE